MKLAIVLIGITIGLVGCATTRSIVEHRLSDTEALVTAGNKELAPGDQVSVSQEHCVSRQSGGKLGGSRSKCTQIRVGIGEVLRLLPEGEAVVRFSPGVPIRTGLFVEKLNIN